MTAMWSSTWVHRSLTANASHPARNGAAENNTAFSSFNHARQKSTGKVKWSLNVRPNDLFECIVPVVGHPVIERCDRCCIDQAEHKPNLLSDFRHVLSGPGVKAVYLSFTRQLFADPISDLVFV